MTFWGVDELLFHATAEPTVKAGTQALVTKQKVTDASGKALDVNERWTDTWLKMPDGKWQCIASHASSVKM